MRVSIDDFRGNLNRVCVSIKMTEWALVGIGDRIDNWKHWKLRWWIFAKVPVDVFSSRSEVSLSITVFFVHFCLPSYKNNVVRYFRLLVFISCSSISLTRACPGASIVFAGYKLFHFTLPYDGYLLQTSQLYYLTFHEYTLQKKNKNCSS